MFEPLFTRTTLEQHHRSNSKSSDHVSTIHSFADLGFNRVSNTRWYYVDQYFHSIRNWFSSEQTDSSRMRQCHLGGSRCDRCLSAESPAFEHQSLYWPKEFVLQSEHHLLLLLASIGIDRFRASANVDRWRSGHRVRALQIFNDDRLGPLHSFDWSNNRSIEFELSKHQFRQLHEHQYQCLTQSERAMPTVAITQSQSDQERYRSVSIEMVESTVHEFDKPGTGLLYRMYLGWNRAIDRHTCSLARIIIKW